MDWIIISAAVAIGLIIGYVIQRSKVNRDLSLAEEHLLLAHNNKVSEIEHHSQMDVSALEEKENLKTEKEEDGQQGRRNNLSKRRRGLNRSNQSLEDNEKDIDSQYRTLNHRRRESQKLQKNSRRIKHDLENIFNQQKSQIVEKLEIDQDDMIKQILEDLHRQVSHEREVWAQHQIEEAEHMSNEMAEEVVDTLVCRLQLKPTVIAQDNRIKVSNKKGITEAFAEGSPIIEQIQDLCHVELLFNEERTEVKVSAYDGVAREICIRLVNRMMQNWKGKEGWFEEQISLITNRLEREMTRLCGDLMRRLRMDDVNVEVVRMQGRLRFRTSYGQNVLDHVLESAYLGGMMASELGIDGKMGRRSSFLHDVGKAIDVMQEGSHPELGGEFLVNIEELPEVAHAAAKHHGPYNPLHLYTALAKSADAMSGGRPGARRESIDNYVERVQSLESIAKRAEGVISVSITQAGRDIQINVDPKKIDDDKLQEISDTVAADIEKELTYPGEIKVSAVREIWTKQVAH